MRRAEVRMARTRAAVIPSILAPFLVVALAGCMSQAIVRPTVGVTPARDPALVEAAILKALQNRGWIAQKEQPGVLLATINRRTHQVVTRITYSGSAFSVGYVSSTNMNYKRTSSGQEEIHRNYNGWVANVVRDTEAYLAGKAPDGGLLQQ